MVWDDILSLGYQKIFENNEMEYSEDEPALLDNELQ
jgi:hypothetical protein